MAIRSSPAQLLNSDEMDLTPGAHLEDELSLQPPCKGFFPRFSFYTPLQGQAPQAVFWVYPCVYFYMIYNTKTDSGIKYLQIFYPET